MLDTTEYNERLVSGDNKKNSRNSRLVSVYLVYNIYKTQTIPTHASWVFQTAPRPGPSVGDGTRS